MPTETIFGNVVLNNRTYLKNVPWLYVLCKKCHITRHCTNAAFLASLHFYYPFVGEPGTNDVAVCQIKINFRVQGNKQLREYLSRKRSAFALCQQCVRCRKLQCKN